MISAPQPLTARRAANEHLQCSQAVNGKPILVTVSRVLMAEHGQLMEGRLDAWLEVAPV